MEDPAQELLAVRPGEDRVERQQLVQGRPQRVDVGPPVDHGVVGRRLLGAHVAERSQQVAGGRQARIPLEPRQAEVGDPEVPAGIEHQVRRLDIPVQHALFVGVLERLGGLAGQAGGLAEQSAALGRAVVRRLRAPELLDPMAERRPVDQPHRVVMDAALAADRVHRDDARMAELRRRLGLHAEPGDLAGVDGGGQRQDLQRHATAQRPLDRLVHHPHPAAAELADDLEIADADRVRVVLGVGLVAGPGDLGEGLRGGLDQMQAPQAGAEPPGDGRVAADPLLGIDRPAGLGEREIGVERGGQLVLGPGIGVGLGNHGWPPISPLSRSSARVQSIRTAPADRPIRAADLLEAEPLEVPEDDHLAIVGRQRGQGVGQQHRLLPPRRRRARGRRRRRQGLLHPRPDRSSAASSDSCRR